MSNYNTFMNYVDAHIEGYFGPNRSYLEDVLIQHCPMLHIHKDLSECLYELPEQGTRNYVDWVLYYFYLYGDNPDVSFDEDSIRIFYTHLAVHAGFLPSIYGRLSEELRKFLLEYREVDPDDTDYESE